MNARLACCLLVCLIACARSSEPQLYTLVARPGSQTWAAAGVLEVRRPHVAGYLDRRELVRRVLQQRLELSRRALWAEPLDAMLARTLAEDLTLRLPNSQVFSELSQVRATPGVIVDLDLQRFEQGADGLVLRALVALHGGTGAPSTLTQVELRRALRGDDSTSQAAAMSDLLGELADRIAQAVTSRLAAPK
jgi:uncharacterized lipoprotein YmbA